MLAVDRYEGEVAENPAEAQELMKAANHRPDATIANLESAHRFLSERSAPTRWG